MNLTGKPPLGQKAQRIARYSATEREYFAWLHTLQCALTGGNYSLDISHCGGYNEGKAMAKKADLDTCLPMVRALHLAQERNHVEFWAGVGIDPLPVAFDLFRVFEAGRDPNNAFAVLNECAARADRQYLIGILKG